MSIEKAGVVLWIKGSDDKPKIFIGNESKYISDLAVDPRYLNTISEFLLSTTENKHYPLKKIFEDYIESQQQLSTNYTTIEQAKNTFVDRSIHLQENLKIGEIRFDTLLNQNANFTVNYRYLPHKHAKRGIVKGNVEGNETPEETAVREVLEETGIIIDPSKLEKFTECKISKPDAPEKYCRFYHYYIGEETSSLPEIQSLLETREREHYGELFKPSFETKEAIESFSKDINKTSACALKTFFSVMEKGPSTYKPPGSSYKPPGSSTYKPPGSSYKPPGSSYKPPRSLTMKKGGRKKIKKSRKRTYRRK